MEYELLDTGIFDEDRYFDVFLEYAKANPEDILIRITVYNRGPEAARLQLLPTLWFRNTWSWKAGSSRNRVSARQTERSTPRTRSWGITCSLSKGRRSCSSPRTRATPAPVGPAKCFSVGQGRLPPVCSFRKQRGRQPGEDRHQGCRPVHPRCSSRRFRGRPLAVVLLRPQAVPFGDGFDERSPRASPTLTSSTPGSRPLLERGRKSGPPAGSGRNALGKAVLPVRRGHVAQGA